MDQVRQGRFLIAPVLFFLDVLIGFYFQRPGLIEEIDSLETATITAAGGLLAASTLPVEFIIGGLSDLLLRVFTCVNGGNYHPLPRHQAMEAIESTLRLGDKPNDKYLKPLFVLGSYAEQYLDIGVRAWIDRMWNAFHTYANCIMALFLGMLFAPCLGYFSCGWFTANIVLCALLAVMAWLRWADVRSMYELQALRIKDGKMPPQDATPATS